MKRLVTLFAMGIVASLIATPAFAQPNSLSNGKFALHLQSHATKNQCGVGPSNVDCTTFNVSGDVGVSYDMYLVAAEGNQSSPGIAGLSFGITYSGTNDDGGANAAGLDVYAWYLCGDLEFPGNNWPATEAGNVITWDANNNCQTNVVGEGIQAVAGAFYCYAYGPDTFRITRREYIPQPDLKFADCTAAETTIPLSAAGFVDFSAGAADQGCNPCIDGTDCAPVPVRPTTWGAIKSMGD